MDGVTVSVLGALAALVVAIVLILKKVQPTYAMLIGAVAGGLIGGAGLTGTVNYIISGTQGIVSAIIRIVTAGILAGALIESGAAERIAEAIMNKLGAKRCLIAITLATWVLTAVGVFGDVACITVAPIALQMAKRAGYHKMLFLIFLFFQSILRFSTEIRWRKRAKQQTIYCCPSANRNSKYVRFRINASQTGWQMAGTIII